MRRLLVLVLLAGTVGPAPLARETATLRAEGRAVAFDDGDSFVLRVPGRGRFGIRLHAVDAPESTQRYARQARQALIDAVAGRPVRVDCYKRDARGRHVCRAWAGGRDLQLLALQSGWAWHLAAYRDEQTLAERSRYAEAQRQARGDRRGLWAQAKPMAPWDCRRRLERRQPCR